MTPKIIAFSKAAFLISTLVLTPAAFAQETRNSPGHAIAMDASGKMHLAVGQDDDGLVVAMAPALDGTLYAAGTLSDGGFVARVNAQGECAGWLKLTAAARGIGVDAAGAVYVAGDGFLRKLDSALNPVYTVPLASAASALAVRPDGRVLVAQASHLATYSPEGQPLTAFDMGSGTGISGIAVSKSGVIFLTGSTTSSGLPEARDALNGPSDAFVTKMHADGVSAEWSVHVGGSGTDSGLAIAALLDGGVLLVGHSGSSDFPGVSPAQSLPDAQHGFIAQLDAGGKLIRSSFVGKPRREGAALDARGAMHPEAVTGGGPAVTVLPLGAGSLFGFTSVTINVVKGPPPPVYCYNCDSLFGSLLGNGFGQVLAVIGSAATGVYSTWFLANVGFNVLEGLLVLATL
jgi:hypothetical protein